MTLGTAPGGAKRTHSRGYRYQLGENPGLSRVERGDQLGTEELAEVSASHAIERGRASDLSTGVVGVVIG